MATEAARKFRRDHVMAGYGKKEVIVSVNRIAVRGGAEFVEGTRLSAILCPVSLLQSCTNK